MFKLLIVLPMMFAGMIAISVVGLVLLPLLALLPALLAVGAGLFAVVFALGMVVFFVRVMAVVVVGLGGLVMAAACFGLLVAGGVVVLALGVAAAHLLLPVLLVLGLIWLIRRSARTTPAPLQIGHG